jgi:hypothetical protein
MKLNYKYTIKVNITTMLEVLRSRHSHAENVRKL